MVKLPENWLTEGTIDFEYKKYLLLAYIQHVQERYTHHKLFPELKEVQQHYENCRLLLSGKQAIRARFPKDPVGVDTRRMQFRYRERFAEPAVLAEVSEILEFSLPVLTNAVASGKDHSEEIEAALQFGPVGILPLRREEGYLFIYRNPSRQAAIFQYKVTLYNDSRERIIHTCHLGTVYKNVGTTFENIKIGLTKAHRDLPNPAAYMVESPKDYPVSETLLPLAKKLMLRYLNDT